jgi:hypothetical protein
MTKIIGLGHYSRVGKDTLAGLIVKEMSLMFPEVRVKQLSFAAKLKDIAHQLYAWDGLREAAYYETEEGAVMRDVPLPTIQKTPVQIWVDLGTPAIRERVYDGTWIDYVLKTDHDCDVVVITDVRFFNEVKVIREFGGTLVKVVRTGYGPRSTVADTALYNWSEWDYVAGPTLKALGEDARLIARSIGDPEGSPLSQYPADRRRILAHERKPVGKEMEEFAKSF